MRASIYLLRVAACVGHLRAIGDESTARQCDAALFALSEGDTEPVTALLARASLGVRDGPVREMVLEAWCLLDAVEADISFARDRVARAVAARCPVA